MIKKYCRFFCRCISNYLTLQRHKPKNNKSTKRMNTKLKRCLFGKEITFRESNNAQAADVVIVIIKYNSNQISSV